jgi:hypothetical protein
LHIKEHPIGQKFLEDEEVKHDVTMRLDAIAAAFCDIGLQKLIPRLNKCLDKGGNNVEK